MLKYALIPCGGFGTRCLPATKAVPKELLTVGERPIIQHIVKEATDSGIKKIVIVLNRQKSAIRAHFDSSCELEAHLESCGNISGLSSVRDIVPKDCSIEYIFQEEALGLGDAVLCASDIFANEDSFCVLLPDMYFSTGGVSLSKMVDMHHRTGYNILAVHLIALELVSKYGIVSSDSLGLSSILERGSVFHIGQLIEKPSISKAPSRYAVSGRYILNGAIFDYLKRQKHEKKFSGELQLTDAIAMMLPDYEHKGFLIDGEIYDCGNLAGLIAANMAWLNSNEKMKNEISSLYNMNISLL